MRAPGYVPAGRMRANCTLDGTWTPDPATLMCNGEIIEFTAGIRVNVGAYIT